MKILAPLLAAICLLAQPARALTIHDLLGTWGGEQTITLGGKTHHGKAFAHYSIFKTTGFIEQMVVETPVGVVLKLKTYYAPDGQILSFVTENGRPRPETRGRWHIAGQVLHSTLLDTKRHGTRTLHLSHSREVLEVTASFSDGTHWGGVLHHK